MVTDRSTKSNKQSTWFLNQLIHWASFYTRHTEYCEMVSALSSFKSNPKDDNKHTKKLKQQPMAQKEGAAGETWHTEKPGLALYCGGQSRTWAVP